jgi:hypothetical protein
MPAVPSRDARAQTGGFAPLDTITDYYAFAKQPRNDCMCLNRGAFPVAPETGLGERIAARRFMLKEGQGRQNSACSKTGNRRCAGSSPSPSVFTAVLKKTLFFTVFHAFLRLK